MESFNQFIEEITPYLIEKRRQFHQFPEVAWTEYVTTYELLKELEKLDFTVVYGKEILISEARMGLPSEEQLNIHEKRAMEHGVPEEVLMNMAHGHTGVIAKLNTNFPGKHSILRFDIDALPIEETNEYSHYPNECQFSSKIKGNMHACAHDGHAAIGLGVAKFLHTYKEFLTGQFTLIFQPAEEGGRGAKPIVEKGWLDDADYFLTGHIGIHSIPVGNIAATTTNFLASTKMDVTFKGKSAHAGLEPNKGKNALLASATASLQLSGIPRHEDGATRINIGKLEAGNGRNIVADLAKMQMETRGQTTSLNEDYMVKEAIRIIKASAAMYDVQEEIEIVGSAPTASCNKEWISILKESCQESQLVTRVINELPLGASEDATFMMNRVQEKGGLATYLVFASPLKEGHHHPSFDFDESVLKVAFETFALTLNKIHKK
ncbi:MAG: amidohydrolase [Bacillaceae bacterium]|nr:amidohydrolase [Bacillaceae bacterium]